MFLVTTDSSLDKDSSPYGNTGTPVHRAQARTRIRRGNCWAALAELPVNVGWIIKRTPDVDSVGVPPLCRRHGAGHQRIGRPGSLVEDGGAPRKPIFRLSAANRTPAGQVFLQENVVLDWTRFADLPALRRAFLLDISRFLLAHGERYGLTVVEGETLRGYLNMLERSGAEGQPRPGPETPLTKATGAGGGGVILAPGKDDVRGARLIGDDEL